MDSNLAKNVKIAFMTSLGVNVGDEFIREGICSFLDEIFENWKPFFVNKVDLETLHKQVAGETGILQDKFVDADIIIQAGAPVYWKIGESTSYNVEWAEELWYKRIFRLGPQKPILNIAAGACQPYPDFAKTFLADPLCVQFARDVATSCQWTSVRDPLASQILYALGLEHEVLPCSAFHAARRSKVVHEARSHIGVNLMPLGGHFRLRDNIDGNAWDNIAETIVADLRRRHQLLFIAHDLKEKEYMERFRSGDEKIFLSSDYRDYLPVYGQCNAVIANRVHGAVCAAGFGRPAIIIGNDSRLLIGDYIGIPSRYVADVTSEEIIELLEKGVAGQEQEGERLITLREESADRYRSAILETLAGCSDQGISAKPRESKWSGERQSLNLASVPELSTVRFRDFMTTMNCFAEKWNLRQFTNWSKVWEYPWVWFNGLSTIDWRHKRVLDLGSEISPMPWFLASLGAHVTLIETNSQCLPIWQQLNDQTGLNMEWHIVSDEKLPLPDKSIDVVTSFSVIEHQPDKIAAINEIARVLKPDGLLALSFDICEPEMGMTFPEWNGEALTMANFEEWVWHHPAFDKVEKPLWNVTDIPEFVSWHLQSAPHHNYAVGAAVLTKNLIVTENIKKILIPRFDTLGDIVLLEGLIATILRQFPDAELTMLVREGYDQLAPLFPSRLEWRTTSLYPFKGPEETDLPIIAALLEDISNDSWDLVLFTTYNRTWIDEVLAAQLTCAPRIALGEAYVPQDWIKTLLESLGLDTENPYARIVPVEERSRETEKYQIFWDALFPGKEKLSLSHLNVPQDAEHVAADILAQLGLGAEMFFVCAPAGTQNISIKKWPAERFAEVITWVDQTYGFHPLLIGHENEQAEIEAVAGLLELKGIAARRWLGKNGEIPVLAALLEKAQFFVGNDTGTMHIAAAVGIPVVGIFGGGHFLRFIPLGDHSLGVVGELPCFGCGWACNFTTPPCITMVGVKDVENAITTVLDNKAVDMNILEVQLPMSDVITIATSIAPRNIEIQAEAISSWLKLGFNVISVNTRGEIDLLQGAFPGVAFAQITRNALSLTGKPYVFFDDILKILAATASNICGIINSDIILTANNTIYNFLNSNAQQCFIYGSRVDVASLEALNGKPYAHGFDYFFFDKSIIRFYPKSDYCLGAPWWDYWAPLIPIINGIPVKKLISPIAVHVKHTIQWSNDCHNYFGQRLANFLLNLDKFVLAGDDFTSELMSILKKNNSLLLSEVINIYIDTNSQDLHINDEELNKATISVSQYSSIKDLMNRYRIFYVHSEATLAAKLEEINDLRQRNEATEVDRAARLDVIHELQSQLEESELDRAARLEVIHDLQRNLKESEADRAARLEVIHDLQRKLEQSDADRNSNLEAIKGLQQKYEESEADRAARLAVIHELQGQLEVSAHDRDARLEDFHELQRNLQESEADRAARLAVILDIEEKWQQTEADRIARIAMIEALKQKLDDSEESHVTALKEIAALKDRLYMTETEVREKTAKIDSLTSHMEAKDELISDNVRAIKVLQENIEAMQSSLSWKITGPVRRIADLLKK